MHEVCLKISVADHLSSIPPPQQVHTQPNAQLILQANSDPIKSQTSHAVEFMSGDNYLLASNMDGVGGIHHH